MPRLRTWLARARQRIRPRQLDAIDTQIVEVLRRTLKPDSNCVDVGAHQGAILEHVVRLASAGRHIAVEPLPAFAAELRDRFPNVTVCEAALADQDGTAGFQHVVTNPAFSGLLRRRYDRPGEQVGTINVRVRRLDDLIAPGQRVDLVKIDVEGGELDVLRGGRRVLAENRPQECNPA